MRSVSSQVENSLSCCVYVRLVFLHIVTYQNSPVTQQLNGASLLYSLVSATMKTNASS
jgi:hypothetical protein